MGNNTFLYDFDTNGQIDSYINFFFVLANRHTTERQAFRPYKPRPAIVGNVVHQHEFWS